MQMDWDLRCPHCGYEVVTKDHHTALCPECGRRFDPVVEAARHGALIKSALALLISGLGLWTVWPASHAGDLGHLLAAAGVGMLAWLSGCSGLQRAWPLAAAALHALVTSHAASDPGGSVAPNPMLLPHLWSGWIDSVRELVDPLMLLTAGAVLRRLAAVADAPGAARAAAWIAGAAAVLILLVAATQLIGATIGSQRAAQVPLELLAFLTRWLAWLVLAGLIVGASSTLAIQCASGPPSR